MAGPRGVRRRGAWTCAAASWGDAGVLEIYELAGNPWSGVIF